MITCWSSCFFYSGPSCNKFLLSIPYYNEKKLMHWAPIHKDLLEKCTIVMSCDWEIYNFLPQFLYFHFDFEVFCTQFNMFSSHSALSAKLFPYLYCSHMFWNWSIDINFHYFLTYNFQKTIYYPCDISYLIIELMTFCDFSTHPTDLNL